MLLVFCLLVFPECELFLLQGSVVNFCYICILIPKLNLEITYSSQVFPEAAENTQSLISSGFKFHGWIL